jgi:hypothetical protein
MTTSGGLSAPIAVAQWFHTPERFPSRRPSLAPAQDTSVHGKPMHMTSTAAMTAQFVLLMSPKLGTPGKRWARILHAPGSMSATQATSPPNTV